MKNGSKRPRKGLKCTKTGLREAVCGRQPAAAAVHDADLPLLILLLEEQSRGG